MSTAATGWPASSTQAGARTDAWRVAAVLFAWLAATAWMRPLMLPDEGRYVGVAWEMLRSGDWLTPTLDGLPFFHKPPLFYWLTASALWLAGPHEWAARVAPLLGAWGGGFALYLFLRRWSGEPRARLALLVLAVQPLFYVGAQFANLDMLVAGCISATVLCAAHAMLCIEAGLPHRRALIGAHLLAALGVLAKGLIGAVLPVLVLVVWLLALRRWRLLPRLLWWPGILAFLALAAPWFLAMQDRHPDFMNYFFVVQHFKRFATGGFNNVQPFWFYPAVLAGCSLPWWPWLRPTLRRVGGDPVRLLMLSWALVVVVFFSLPASKLLGYVLPAVPPLAALMADGVAQAGAASRRRGLWISVGLSALVGLALVVGLAVRPPHSGRELGAALAARHVAGEPVIALLPYPYDLPFYAGLQAPIVVVDHWSGSGLPERDDWRKELADAARFAPALAARTLLDPEALPALLCRTAVSWIITDAHARPAYLAAAEAVHQGRDATLWRLRLADPATAAKLPCAQTPSVGSPGR